MIDSFPISSNSLDSADPFLSYPYYLSDSDDASAARAPSEPSQPPSDFLPASDPLSSRHGPGFEASHLSPDHVTRGETDRAEQDHDTRADDPCHEGGRDLLLPGGTVGSHFLASWVPVASVLRRGCFPFAFVVAGEGGGGGTMADGRTVREGWWSRFGYEVGFGYEAEIGRFRSAGDCLSGLTFSFRQGSGAGEEGGEAGAKCGVMVGGMGWG